MEQFQKAAIEAVRELVKPTPRDTGDGPQSLKELFRIGTDPAPNERPRVVEQSGSVDAAGRWRVNARIRLKPKRTPIRLTPAVYFLAETGAGLPGLCSAGFHFGYGAEVKSARWMGVG